MKTIFSRVKLNRRQTIIMVVFALVASLAQLAAPTLVSMMIDGVSDNKEQMIIILAVVMIALSVLACVTNIVSTNLTAKLTARFSADLRRQITLGAFVQSGQRLDDVVRRLREIALHPCRDDRQTSVGVVTDRIIDPAVLEIDVKELRPDIAVEPFNQILQLLIQRAGTVRAEDHPEHLRVVRDIL